MCLLYLFAGWCHLQNLDLSWRKSVSSIRWYPSSCVFIELCYCSGEIDLHVWLQNLEHPVSVKWIKSGHQKRCSIEIGFLKNFTKFTGKHLCHSHLKKKIKKDTLTQLFSCEFWKISKSTFLYRTPLVTASDESKALKSTNSMATFPFHILTSIIR